MKSALHLSAVLLLVALAAEASPARAQTVEGTVTGSSGRVLVSLLDESDRVRIRRVSDRHGVFQLPAPGPGRYRVRIDRVGFEPTSSDRVAVAERERATVEVEAPSVPLALSSLPTPAPGQCRAVNSAPDRLAATWAEAEKALRLLKWAEDGSEVLVDALVHRRELETDGRTVSRADQPDIREAVRRVTPPVNAADLIERGFIREDDTGGFRYFGVTPEVILDPAFHETHCFSLVDQGALLGLAFEPLNRDEARPDVAGVLWVQAEDGRPLLLEYGYRNVDPTLVPASAAGQATFTELPDGSWVIPELWVRMPLLQVREDVGSGEETWTVSGLLEDRVQMLRARVGEDVWSVTPESGEIAGEVLSDEGAPLDGAMVSLVGTPYRARSDESGRFSFSGLLDGAWRVAVEHPAYDQLPLAPAVEIAEVEAGSTAMLRFAPPSPTEAAGELCAGTEGLGNSVALIGQVRDSVSGEPLVGIPVAIRFTDPRREGRPYHEGRASTGAGGYYLYCDAPSGEMVRIRAQIPGADHEDDVELMASAGVVRRDLTVRFSTEVAAGAVFGVIRDLTTGDPIEQASITIAETGTVGMTNQNGFFAFSDVPPGLYVIEVGHIAYENREIVVRVDGGVAKQVNVELLTDAVPIEGITVSVLPRRLFDDMVELQRRMELGFGEFLVRSDLEVRGGTLGTALTGLGGVRVLNGTGRAGERFIVLRSARDLQPTDDPQTETRVSQLGSQSFAYCFPAVWVDGRRWSRPRTGGVGHDPVDFSQFVTADIEAVEIYRGAGSVPGEFGGGNAACGAVVLWTRRGGRSVRGEMGPGRGGEGGGQLQDAPSPGAPW